MVRNFMKDFGLAHDQLFVLESAALLAVAAPPRIHEFFAEKFCQIPWGSSLDYAAHCGKIVQFPSLNEASCY